MTRTRLSDNDAVSVSEESHGSWIIPIVWMEGVGERGHLVRMCVGFSDPAQPQLEISTYLIG